MFKKKCKIFENNIFLNYSILMSLFERLTKAAFAEILSHFNRRSQDPFTKFDDYFRRYREYHRRSGHKDHDQGEYSSSRERRYRQRSYSENGSRMTGHQQKIAQYYANLEVPYGSDLATVRTAWKNLLKKYHPDKHYQDEEKKKKATILTQKINEAYFTIEKELKNK